LLFAADRADHLAKEILPALENGAAVVADRYFLSSLAYGAVDVEMEWLAQINSRFLAPDLTIYLDVPPEVCVQRIAANGESAELFERVEILEIVRQNYQKAMKMFDGEMKIVSVDGNRNKEEVFGDIINKMNVKLKNQNGK
jgi:dTMP kinase